MVTLGYFLRINSALFGLVIKWPLFIFICHPASVVQCTALQIFWNCTLSAAGTNNNSNNSKKEKKKNNNNINQKEGQLWQKRQLWHIETTVFISHSRDFVGVSGIILTITRARYDASSVTCLDLQHLFCTSCMQIWHSDRLATQLNKGILAQNFHKILLFYQKKTIWHPPQDTICVCVFFKLMNSLGTPRKPFPHCGWPETVTAIDRSGGDAKESVQCLTEWVILDGLRPFFAPTKQNPNRLGWAKNKTAAQKEKIQAVGGEGDTENCGFLCFFLGAKKTTARFQLERSSSYSVASHPAPAMESK